MTLRQTLVLSLSLSLLACKSGEKPPAATPPEPGAAKAEAVAVAQPKPPGAARAEPEKGTASGPANVGQPAPDFSLPDLEGKVVRLADLKGKTVVLEWFNPGCPFVRASHTKGSLVGTAERHRAKGVEWFAVNSGAAGKQGAGREASLEGKARFDMKHPILLDESGAVGKLYGAKTTPHMFVIGPDGLLAYKGAIDNSPDGEGESPEGGSLVNYVDQALTALAERKPVPTPETKSYGCSVKYAD